MTCGEKMERAKLLRDEGWKRREIADEFGISISTVHNWLTAEPHPPRDCLNCGQEFVPDHGNEQLCSESCRHTHENARKRRCEHNHRATCSCGRELAVGSMWRGGTRCQSCREADDARRVDERAKQIKGWWAAGLSMDQICRNLGWTKGHLGQEMDRLRAKGYNLPYRYELSRPRFRDQVAA